MTEAMNVNPNVNPKKEPIDLNEVTGYNKANKDKVKRNPNELDNDAFMRLFLEQLKNQDPTAPMETDKIITQTAQLTQVEMQEQTKQTMIEVAEAMKSTKVTNEELKNFQSDMKTTLEKLLEVLGGETTGANTVIGAGDSPYASINMIGKIVETNINGINLTQGQGMDFELYFDEPIELASANNGANGANANLARPYIQIFNENKELVREFDISHLAGQSGYVSVHFDGLDNAQNALPSGAYNVIANYNFKADGSHNVARVGRGEVQSVIFDDGVPNLRLGELVVPLDSALEFYAHK